MRFKLQRLFHLCRLGDPLYSPTASPRPNRQEENNVAEWTRARARFFWPSKIKRKEKLCQVDVILFPAFPFHFEYKQ